MAEPGAPAPASRRLTMLALVSAAWLANFAVLARYGTWTPFAVAGVILVSGALLSGAVPGGLLRPSKAAIGLGLAAGALMVGLTHGGYAVVALRVPEVRAATARLVELLNVGGFSPEARAGLVVVVASCEEVLFRGALPGRGAPGLRGLARGDLARIAVFAAGYALATGTLGSPILIACAFVCGLAWGLLRVASGSLVPAIVAHVVWDLGVLVVWPLEAGG